MKTSAACQRVTLPQSPPATSFLRTRLVGLVAAACVMMVSLAQAIDLDRPVYILTESGQLVTATQNTLAPAALGTPVSITGVASGETLVAIDVRPQNNGLYGLGVNPVTETGTLYHITPRTGLAVPVGGVTGLVAFTTNGTTPIDLPDISAGYDIDFNPSVDRVRVVTGSGLNFRLNPNTGGPVDGDNTGLTTGTVTGLNPDGSANGATTGVQGTAYANSQPNNGAITTQYTIDATTGSIYIQNPPNQGTQTGAVAINQGGSPLAFTSVRGFDIAPGVNAVSNNAPVVDGIAYAVLTTASTSKLYQVNLSTGAVTEIGDIAARSFAIQSRSPASIGLASSGTSLVRFSPLTPGTQSTVAVGAITAGETLVAIDYRPATGQLYGLGVNATANNATLYLLDPQTGAATAVGAAGSIAFVLSDGTTPVDLPVASAGYDIDFNPTVDRLRVVSGSGLNFRVNPINGAAVDGDLALGAGMATGVNTDGLVNGLGVTGVQGTAYTNSFHGAPGTTVTTQYTLDATTDTLYIQNPPNNGTQTSALPVTLDGTPLDFSAPLGFDILGSVAVTTSNMPAVGNAYFTANVTGTSGLYRLNLATGAATSLATFATPFDSYAIAYAPGAPVIATVALTALTPVGATLGATVTDDSGSPVLARGIVYSLTSANAAPVLGGAGVTNVTAPGTTGAFSLPVTGLTTGSSYSYAAYVTTDVGTVYTAVSTFTPPALVEPVFDTSVVSQDFSLNLQKAAGAKLTVKGLPTGLKLTTTLTGTTATITGRLPAAGVYQVTVTSTGPGALTTTYIKTFIVQAVPATAVGTFIGLVDPNNTLNANAAGRVDLTTTTNGSFTLKIAQGAKTVSTKGFLTTGVGLNPRVVIPAMADGTAVDLTLDAMSNLTGSITRSASTAVVEGWRKTYDRVFRPALGQMGYYTVGLKPAVSSIGNSLIPQGSGYASVTIAEDGTTKFTGKAADNSVLATAGFLGPDGQVLVHQQLYGKIGAVFGILTLTPDVTGNYTENILAGSLAWTKPLTKGAIYPGVFSLAMLDVYGKYMARAATGSLVLGLPSTTNPSTLDFTDGGLALASRNPDLADTVTFSAETLKAGFPTLGGVNNPASTSLVINATNGSLTGSFALMDGAVKRTVKFQGTLVRSADGSTTGLGYFILPQIPSTTALSGGVTLIP